MTASLQISILNSSVSVGCAPCFPQLPGHGPAAAVVGRSMDRNGNEISPVAEWMARHEPGPGPRYLFSPLDSCEEIRINQCS